MLAIDDVHLYLSRLSYAGSVDVSLELLNKLHCHHLLNVPFENLDIPLGHKIELAPKNIFTKIIHQKRGGFCYELNYCFANLLESLGFGVSLLSARVFNDGDFGKAFAHLLLLVEAGENKFIVDVGFGRSFVEPIRFIENKDSEVVVKGSAAYKIIIEDGGYILLTLERNQEWLPLYMFAPETYEISDFIKMCEYQQSAEDSIFTQKSVCSIATAQGRKTISNGRFIETVADIQAEHIIENEMEYRALLLRHFSIELPEDAEVTKLLAINYPA